MQKEKLKIIILRESLFQSILADSFTVMAAVFLIGVGIFFKSVPLQWVGFVFVSVFIIGMYRLASGKTARISVDQIISGVD